MTDRCGLSARRQSPPMINISNFAYQSNLPPSPQKNIRLGGYLSRQLNDHVWSDSCNLMADQLTLTPSPAGEGAAPVKRRGAQERESR